MPEAPLSAAQLDQATAWQISTAVFPKGYEFTADRVRDLSPLAGDLAVIHTDAARGADALAEWLATIRSLTILSVVGSDLTDAGLEHLGQIVGLQHLHIRNTAVTPAAIERFRQRVPNCLVLTSQGTYQPQWLPPPEFSRAPGEFDRAVAEWVLSKGGLVGLVSNGRPHQEVPAGVRSNNWAEASIARKFAWNGRLTVEVSAEVAWPPRSGRLWVAGYPRSAREIPAADKEAKRPLAQAACRW